MKKEYIASPSTLCGAERFIYSDGKAKGVEAVRMYNGKLDLTVILDRGMDIFKLFYRGTPISYVSKNGLVSPKLAETGGYSFLNSFDAGFLYTCGLNNIGGPCAAGPLHGSNSYIPAENVSVVTEEKDGEYYLTLKGELHFTELFGRNLVMRREISMKYLGDEVTVTDRITNEEFVDAEYMLMYHANMGYPLLSENTKLTIDRAKTDPVTDIYDLDRCLDFEAPTPARAEEVYRHTLNEGYGVKARLENDTLAMDVIFDTAEFPYIYEWKCMSCGDYVVGVEPMTTPMPDKVPCILKAGETAKHSVTWKFEEK